MTKKALNLETGTITITFDDTESRTFDSNELSDTIRERLMIHGLSQKLGDSYSGTKSVRESGGDPIAFAKENVSGVWDSLLEGEWSVRGEGSARVTYLIRALSEFKDKTVEEVIRAIEGKDDKWKKSTSAHPAIAAIIARLKSEDAIEKAAKLEQMAEGADVLDLEL